MLKPGVQYSLARGLEQWLWFLGVDASCPKNNLLLRNGSVKFKPAGTQGSSRYRQAWRGNCIELHSFCVGVYPEDADGFIFIRARHQCFLYVAANPPIPGSYPEQDVIPAETEEPIDRFHAAAVRFLDWLAAYETWVDRECGPGYRAQCYQAYHMKWLPPISGLAWFRHFCSKPREVMPVCPEVSDMTLLESAGDLDELHPTPPPARAKVVLRVPSTVR